MNKPTEKAVVEIRETLMSTWVHAPWPTHLACAIDNQAATAIADEVALDAIARFTDRLKADALDCMGKSR